MMIDVLPILLVAILVLCAKPMKPIAAIDEDYLSLYTVKGYKGLFSIIILFHHLSQCTKTGVAFRAFTYVGYLAVAAFFFYSGYGLQKSYMLKKEKYSNGFLLKRIPSIMIPYILVTAIYWMMNYLYGKTYSFKDVILGIFKGKAIVSNSWFISTILFFYFVFWIMMKVCKSNYSAMILGGCVWFVIYTVYCMELELGSFCYNSAHLLIVGMIWAMCEDKINSFIKKHQCIIPLTWVVFIIIFAMKRIIQNNIPFIGIDLIVDMITAVLFVFSVLWFSMKVKIGNPILSFIGEISYEVYLIHGLFITVFRNSSIYTKNEFGFALLVIASSILSGIVLHFLYKSFQKAIHKK